MKFSFRRWRSAKPANKNLHKKGCIYSRKCSFNFLLTTHPLLLRKASGGQVERVAKLFFSSKMCSKALFKTKSHLSTWPLLRFCFYVASKKGGWNFVIIIHLYGKISLWFYPNVGSKTAEGIPGPLHRYFQSIQTGAIMWYLFLLFKMGLYAGWSSPVTWNGFLDSKTLTQYVLNTPKILLA